MRRLQSPLILSQKELVPLPVRGNEGDRITVFHTCFPLMKRRYVKLL